MLTYRVATELGRSQRQRTRLCRRIVVGAVLAQSPEAPRSDVSTTTDSGRRLRSEVLARLRSELGSRVSHGELDAALRNAVLLDELALLPPRQRFALWAAATAQHTVADISARTGWTPQQVARLLRASLQTVTAHTRT